MKPEQWERAQQLYHAALEHEPRERAAWLEQACAGDAALRHEVESLLAAASEVGDFLLSPALRVEARALAAEQRPSAVGQQLNQYQLVAWLGAGGMGEVYLAHDRKLQRKVALKLLHARFTQDADQARRFAREAKAASALNHPNILTVYETGEVGVTRFIAAEFIEGVTLRQRLTEGRMELREAIEIALQIAAALAAAHQVGIVHRDIKPENIMLRPDGLVKVLDFGLARLTEPQLLAEEGQTVHSTESGAVVGTPRYMAPEQAQGQKVDALADIFSLGVVLYEMITQRLPFNGATTAEVFAALLTREPEPLAQHTPGVPLGLERVIGKALAKERAARYQNIQELRTELEAQLARVRQAEGQSWPVLRWRVKRLAWSMRWLVWRHRRAITVSLLGVLLVVSMAWLVTRRVAGPNEAVLPVNPRISELFTIPIVSEVGNLADLKFSPDGKWLAYSLAKANDRHIWVKRIEGDEPKQLTTGEVEDMSPVWSPDSQELAFASNRGGAHGIWTLPTRGGTPKLLSRFEFESEYVGLSDWTRNGQTIYFVARDKLSEQDNLYKFDLATKQSSAVTHFKDAEAHFPCMSPDEKQISYVGVDKSGHRIYVVPLGGGQPREISQGTGVSASEATWFPDGKRVSYIFQQINAQSGIYLGWLDGRPPLLLTPSSEAYNCQTVSPDGTKIASASDKTSANLFACDVRTGAETAQTSGLNQRLVPEVSPDGETIVFQANESLTYYDFALFLQPRAPGSYAHQFVSNGAWAKWSPVEDKLVFLRRVNNEQFLFDLWQISRRGGAEQRLTTRVVAGASELIPFSPQHTFYDWSPDGKQIAYSSRKAGQAMNVWVVASDGASDVMFSQQIDPKVTITSPFWSPDGKRIAYTAFSGMRTGMLKGSIGVARQGETVTVYNRDQQMVFPIGWSASGQEILVLQGKFVFPSQPLREMSLVGVPFNGEKPRIILQRPNDYLHNVSLSHDRRFIAVASKREGKDNIEILPVNGGPVRTLTRNSDSSIVYSGLAWAPDDKTLFYSKQMGWTQVSLIENFQ